MLFHLGTVQRTNSRVGCLSALLSQGSTLNTVNRNALPGTASIGSHRDIKTTSKWSLISFLKGFSDMTPGIGGLDGLKVPFPSYVPKFALAHVGFGSEAKGQQDPRTEIK